MKEIWEASIVETGWPAIEGGMWIYVGFNFAEALAWLAFAAFVICRWIRNRKTRYEWVYAGSFLLFGVSDLLEMAGLTVGLLLFKAGVLLAIISSRKVVTDHYPEAKF